MPSTQAVIEHVKQDMDNFEDDLKKVSKPSVERQQIIFLGKQLQSVKRKYYGTLKKLTYYEKQNGTMEDSDYFDSSNTKNARKRAIYTSPPLNPYSKLKKNF